MEADATKLTEAVIYTDGSSGVSGDGGWAAIVATPYFGIEISGYTDNTTNNAMEMRAALEGLRILKEPHAVTLVSDSAYLLNTLKNEWYIRWFEEEANGRAYVRPNIELWKQLVKATWPHEMTYVKVKGHNGHEHNERVDKLAVAARKEKLETAEVLYGATV